MRCEAIILLWLLIILLNLDWAGKVLCLVTTLQAEPGLARTFKDCHVMRVVQGARH